MKKVLLTAIIIGMSASASQAFFWSSDDNKDRPHWKDRPSVEKVFEKADADKDGKLSKEEFLAHKEMRMKKRMEKGKGKFGKGFDGKKFNPEKKFAKMDANSDGFITQEEMKVHREMRKEKRMERKGKRRNWDN